MNPTQHNPAVINNQGSTIMLLMTESPLVNSTGFSQPSSDSQVILTRTWDFLSMSNSVTVTKSTSAVCA